MAWFFTDTELESSAAVLTGETAVHIEKSLRMKPGEEITLCTPAQMQCTGKIRSISGGQVVVQITEKKPCEQEPDVQITLYQALPKGDKMELIIQKCVELGIYEIVPVVSARCISRPDEKTLVKKQQRWQKIAVQAAMQSRRGQIPRVRMPKSFAQAVQEANHDLLMLFYECGGEPVRSLLQQKPETIGMFIGSEGGFEEAEVQQVLQKNGKTATLGRRILRAETAPLAALSVLMYETGNFE